MKRIFAPIVLVFVVLLSGCVSGSPEVLEPLSVFPNHTVVRVNGATLKLSTMMLQNEGGFVKKIKSVEVFTCEDCDCISEIEDVSRGIAESRGMQLMIEQRDSAETVNIYGLESQKKAGVMKEILIQTIEPSEFNVVFVEGEIDIASCLKNSGNFKKLNVGTFCD